MIRGSSSIGDSNSKGRTAEIARHNRSHLQQSPHHSFEHKRGFLGSQSNIANQKLSVSNHNMQSKSNSFISEDVLGVFIQGTNLDIADLRFRIREFITSFRLGFEHRIL